jgi:hypothetical protein
MSEMNETFQHMLNIDELKQELKTRAFNNLNLMFDETLGEALCGALNHYYHFIWIWNWNWICI